MKDTSKAIKWLCLTMLVAAGIKYLPPYLVEERRLDLQERILDLREEAFLRQQVKPTVSDPSVTHLRPSQVL